MAEISEACLQWGVKGGAEEKKIVQNRVLSTYDGRQKGGRDFGSKKKTRFSSSSLMRVRVKYCRFWSVR